MDEDAMREIAALSVEVANLKAGMVSIKRDVADIRSDVKKLAAVANMGKGALWAVLKLTGLLALTGGAVAWLWERLH
jgi:hypothetical protein